MIKIEAVTLEAAYQDAASKLECSVTELKIEVVQIPSKGILGLFKKSAIIVAVKEKKPEPSTETSKSKNQAKREVLKEESKEDTKPKEVKQKTHTPTNKKKETNLKTSNKADETIERDKRKALKQEQEPQQEQKKRPKKPKKKQQAVKEETHNILNDTIMPASFVSMQDEEEEYDVSSYLADYDEDEDDCEECKSIIEIASTIKKEINELFDLTCFKIDSIDVSVYDENTLLIEFKGDDAALLIGKEGYRYKALSYMIFNWVNTKYQVQLRLEIAEFLKNQEESISKYLVGVCENIERDGRAQTKILDGVLVQIALNELRDKYPDKYIVIRSTRDGLKYIIVNDYHSN